MPLLPPGAFDLVALAGILAGLALVVGKRDVPKAYGLGVIVLGVYALDVVAGLVGQRPPARALGFVAALFLAGETWWTPLTSAFAHADLGHLVGNLFILLTAGPALEDRVGARRFLLIYFVAHAAAMVAHLGMAYGTPLVSPWSVALGASGAIFGVLSAFAVRYPRERLPLFLGFWVIWLPSFVILVLYLVFNVAYLMGDWVGTPGGIAWWGHFAGFLVGLAWAPRLPAAPHAVPRTGRGLPDAEKLEPLATTPDARRVLDRIRQFTPETRTKDDAAYAEAWLDQFFEKVACPTCGEPFVRSGLRATCKGGETTVEFGRA